MSTEQTTRVIPAGWYQDPADEGKVRWWNGITWTEHVEVKPTGQTAAYAGALAIEAAAPISAEEREAEARELERQYNLSVDGTERMTRHASLQLDHRGPDTGTIPIPGFAVPHHHVSKTGTASAWLLGLIPLISAVLTVVAGYVYFYVTPTPLVAAVVVVVWVLQFLWAVGDARALQSRGLDAPSPMLALALPLVGALLYLIARRGKAEGATPIIVFVALLVLAIGAPAAVALTGNAANVTKALEVQQAIRADLVDSGEATSVTCPFLLESVAVGSIFTCDAVLPDSTRAHVWVSMDTEAGEFSWALANR